MIGMKKKASLRAHLPGSQDRFRAAPPVTVEGNSRTVLGVKGSLHRGQHRRALDPARRSAG